MAEERGFLQRWSKRKRAAATPPDRAAASEAAASAVAHGEAAATAADDPAEPLAAADDHEAEASAPPAAVDPATLPSLDGIGAGGDVKAFLQQGVPRDLRRAALRRLWSASGQIRDFREVADYDWDFNAPGYGALRPGDDPRAMAERLLASTRQGTAGPEPTLNSTSPDEVAGDAEESAVAPVKAPTVNSTLRDSGERPVEQPAAGEDRPTGDSTFGGRDGGGWRGAAAGLPPPADAPTANSTFGSGEDWGRVRLSGQARGGELVGDSTNGRASALAGAAERTAADAGRGTERLETPGERAPAEESSESPGGGPAKGARPRRHGGAMPR